MYTYMHVTTINEKRVYEFEIKDGNKGEFGVRKGKEKMMLLYYNFKNIRSNQKYTIRRIPQHDD